MFSKNQKKSKSKIKKIRIRFFGRMSTIRHETWIIEKNAHKIFGFFFGNLHEVVRDFFSSFPAGKIAENQQWRSVFSIAIIHNLQWKTLLHRGFLRKTLTGVTPQTSSKGLKISTGSTIQPLLRFIKACLAFPIYLLVGGCVFLVTALGLKKK